jgi:Ca-activated chloride channel family protein
MLPYGQALCVPFFDVIQKNLKKTVGPYKKRSSPFFILAYLFLTVAAMRPVFYAQPIYIPSTGRQMMLVLDVSGSMAEQDFVYNNRRSTRLGVVQNVAQDFIKSRQGDAVGLTIFGSEAFLYTPLTPDTQTASQMLTEIGVGMAGDRTAIGDALLVALKQMKDIPSDKKVIILLSDGFANAGIVRPEEAIQVAKENNVKIYTVGLGSDKQTVQSFFFTQEINPSKDLVLRVKLRGRRSKVFPQPGHNLNSSTKKRFSIISKWFSTASAMRGIIFYLKMVEI